MPADEKIIFMIVTAQYSTMKTAIIAIGIAIVVAVFACGCTATSTGENTEAAISAPESEFVIPDITGTWTGDVSGHTKLGGFGNFNHPTFIIAEQDGSAFYGYKEVIQSWDGQPHTENFSGVITNDGEIYISDHDIGFFIGQILSPDQIELVYMEDQDEPKALLITLSRQ